MPGREVACYRAQKVEFQFAASVGKGNGEFVGEKGELLKVVGCEWVAYDA